MKTYSLHKLFLLVIVLITTDGTNSSLRVVVRDETTKQPVAGATVTVKDTSISATTDAQGVAQLSDVPDGVQTMEQISEHLALEENRRALLLTV